MWSAPTVTAEPATTPIDLAAAKEFLRIEADDTTFDVELQVLVGDAIGHVEAVTSTRAITQTVQIAADSFADLAALPIGPVREIVSVSYTGTDGIAVTFDGAAIELFGMGLAMGIRPVFGTAWPMPARREGVITVTLVVGYGDDAGAVPAVIIATMLRLVKAGFDGKPFDPQPALVNDRIWL